MNRIDGRFKKLKAADKKAFIAYITAGDPKIDVTGELVLALEKSGADLIELGIPFSDPLADGPTIQAASQRALEKRVNLKRIFKMVSRLRSRTDIPIAFMTYYNPVLRYGLEGFARDCRRNGVDGMIVPDLPYEEGKDLIKYARREDVATIFLIAPTSTRDRIERIAKSSTGFIYYVSLTGVTGARKTLPDEIRRKVRLIRALTKRPICVGFGVSSPKLARKLAIFGDGIIVGSAIVEIIEDNLKDKRLLLSRVSRFSKSLADAIHNV